MAYFTCLGCGVHYSSVEAHSPSTCTGIKPAIKPFQLWNRRTPNGRLIGIEVVVETQNKLWDCRITNGQHAGVHKLFSEETIYSKLELDH